MTLLKVKDLHVSYQVMKGELKAVQGVSFDLEEQETLGVVGESGCGKSTLALAILNLMPPQGRIVSGSVVLHDRELLRLSQDEMRRVRGDKVAMVFQDPMTSLNPVKKIGAHFVEVIQAHRPSVKREEALERARSIVARLGVPAEKLQDYPHQLSGGMKQRIMIGLGLALDPDLLIADEPTTALDVVIEAQILELMAELKAESKLSMILITHNLGVVAEVADKIAIMYGGEIVEFADTKTIFDNPMFPYTKLLLKLVPNIRAKETSLEWIPGTPPDLTVQQAGCKFAARCPYVFDRCRAEHPSLKEREEDHWVACHLYDEGENGN